MPAAEKVACVSVAFGSAKLTGAGPATALQVVASEGGCGSPSSLTVPSSAAALGSVMI